MTPGELQKLRALAERFQRDDMMEDLDAQQWGEAVSPHGVIALLDELAAMTAARDEAVAACREVVRQANAIHDRVHEDKLLLGYGIHEFLHHCIGASRAGFESGPRGIIGKGGGPK